MSDALPPWSFSLLCRALLLNWLVAQTFPDGTFVLN
jgi:hypothetical protein